MADLVLAAKLSKVAKPLCASIGVNVLKHTWVVLDVSLERIEGLTSLLAAAPEHTDIVGAVVDEHTAVDGSVQRGLVGTEEVATQPGSRRHSNARLGSLRATQGARVRIMRHRLEVFMDALAAAGDTECSRVGQRADAALVAFRRHLKHRQPQRKACSIELRIALVTKLAMLQARMTELSRVNDAKVERLSRRAWLVGVHLAERPKMLVGGGAVTKRRIRIVIERGADRRTVHCLSKPHDAVVGGRLGDKIIEIISLAIEAQRDDIPVSKRDEVAVATKRGALIQAALVLEHGGGRYQIVQTLVDQRPPCWKRPQIAVDVGHVHRRIPNCVDGGCVAVGGHNLHALLLSRGECRLSCSTAQTCDCRTAVKTRRMFGEVGEMLGGWTDLSYIDPVVLQS